MRRMHRPLTAWSLALVLFLLETNPKVR